jgi:hypothetical protein
MHTVQHTAQQPKSMSRQGFYPAAKKITKKWTSRVNRRAARGVINEHLAQPVELFIRPRPVFAYGDDF